MPTIAGVPKPTETIKPTEWLILVPRTLDVRITPPEKHLPSLHSQKTSRWRSSRCGSSNRTFLNSSRSKAWCGNSRLPGRQSRLDKGDPGPLSDHGEVPSRPRRFDGCRWLRGSTISGMETGIRHVLRNVL